MFAGPATVISGIFGMNFEKTKVFVANNGFAMAIAFMVLIPLTMVYYFKKRKWF